MALTDSSITGQSTLVGQRIGRFKLHGPIGGDALGLVYAATVGKQPAVVKLIRTDKLPADADSIKALPVDLEAVQRLRGRYFPQILDVAYKGQYVCVVSEYTDRATLAQYLPYHSDLPLRSALFVFREIVAAVAEIHKAGLVHGNLGPDNVAVTRQGHVQILNLGYARLESSVLARAPQMMAGAMAAHWPPEKCAAQAVTQASDVYSLGALGFHLLADGPPFEAGSPAELKELIRTAEPPDLRTIRETTPPELADIIKRSLAKEPSLRPASARHLLAQLDQVLEIGSAPLPPIPEAAIPSALRTAAPTPMATAGRNVAATGPARRRPPWILAIPVVAVVTTLVGGLIWIFSMEPTRTAAATPPSTVVSNLVQPPPTPAARVTAVAAVPIAPTRAATPVSPPAVTPAVVIAPTHTPPPTPPAAASPTVQPTNGPTAAPTVAAAAGQRKHEIDDPPDAYWVPGQRVKFRILVVGRRMGVFVKKGYAKFQKVRDVDLPNWVPLRGPVEFQAQEGPAATMAKFDDVAIWTATEADFGNPDFGAKGRDRLYSTTFPGETLPKWLKAEHGEWNTRGGSLTCEGSADKDFCRVRSTEEFGDIAFDFEIFRKQGGWVGVSLRHPKLRLTIDTRLHVIPLEDAKGAAVSLDRNAPEP